MTPPQQTTFFPWQTDHNIVSFSLGHPQSCVSRAEWIWHTGQHASSGKINRQKCQRTYKCSMKSVCFLSQQTSLQLPKKLISSYSLTTLFIAFFQSFLRSYSLPTMCFQSPTYANTHCFLLHVSICSDFSLQPHTDEHIGGNVRVQCFAWGHSNMRRGWKSNHWSSG